LVITAAWRPRRLAHPDRQWRCLSHLHGCAESGETGLATADPVAGHHPPSALSGAHAAPDLADRGFVGAGHRITRRMGRPQRLASVAQDERNRRKRVGQFADHAPAAQRNAGGAGRTHSGVQRHAGAPG
nr:hypothetical protein [Tanacetum cinerariifolium]